MSRVLGKQPHLLMKGFAMVSVLRPRSSRSLRTFVGAALAPAVRLAMALALPIIVACSSDKPADGPCQDSQCLAGNKCVDDGTSLACRLTCKTQTECPPKFHCVATAKGDVTYCTADQGYSAGITPKPKGQWGTHCDPVLDEKKKPQPSGLDANPACDSEQGFWCYGENPTDAAAFCTQYDCKSDAECTGGYWCAPINLEPSIRRANRSVKETTTVCLPRSYCAPCKHDIDCPSQDGSPQYCVADDSGTKFCTSECQGDGNCRLDATCVEDGGRNVCKPRAGTCKGDGSFCSPCYADGDCQGDSVCLLGSYSRERFCAPKSASPCKETASGVTAECPASPKLDGLVGVGCQTTKDNPDVPKDYCLPFVQYGKEKDSAVPGCWTKKK